MDTHSSNDQHGGDRYLSVAVVLGALIIGAALYFGHSATPATTGTTGQQTAQPAVNIKDIKTAGDPYIGNANAPVTVAFWSDYQCPFCKAFEVGGVQGINIAPALPEIIKNYVDTGKVKVVFMDFPFLGVFPGSNPARDDSTTGALYGRAVWKLYPKQYFAWRTAMYKAQDAEGNQGFGDAASIDKLDATIPGLDAQAITADIQANKATYLAAIAADKTQGQQIGVNGTPSFVVGTDFIQGAVSYATFQSAIDTALSNATTTP
ncbi:MAG TPA: thioredoxin domain-containing protein [Candidatus Paceibacterota bacterium]|nr:thioredoxin domain-containing protein [Candidatus Paceibacterota bacterium]